MIRKWKDCKKKFSSSSSFTFTFVTFFSFSFGCLVEKMKIKIWIFAPFKEVVQHWTVLPIANQIEAKLAAVVFQQC
jgi:hypothetical protein